ncbi:hypothetical protein ACFSUS_05715 [Spirosoma soli]|uniref:Uncharacterized protein n=1 Tax=Spirosoma soli TaxID=1770529 RepID=A0ABW5LZA2_9BACT
MTTIQIKVSDDVLARYGAQALAERFERLLAWEELSREAQEIKKNLDESDIDWESMMEESRQKVWETYKHTIKDKLPPEAFK